MKKYSFIPNFVLQTIARRIVVYKRVSLKSGLIMVFMFMAILTAHATAPRELTLEYDAVNQELLISMKHPTVENREHYIRTISVIVNTQDPKVYRFGFQRLASEVKMTLPLELKSGDLVHVKASCSQGGSAQADLVIASDQAKLKKPSLSQE